MTAHQPWLGIKTRDWFINSDTPQSNGRSGRALRGIETPRDLDAHHGQPRPSSPQPDYTLLGLNPITAIQGQTTDEAPTKPLTQTGSPR